MIEHHALRLVAVPARPATGTLPPMEATSRRSAAATRVVNARPQDVLAVLRDYRERHPRLLPKPYYARLLLEQGGVGDGTVALVTMRVLGRWRELRVEVTEPEPGRALQERDILRGDVTTFVVDAAQDGRSRVHARTLLAPPRGAWDALGASVARAVARRILSRRLDALARHFGGE